MTKVKGEKEQVKRVRFREEEEPEETRAQITTVVEEGQVQSKVGTRGRSWILFPLKFAVMAKEKETEEKVHLEEKEESEAKNHRCARG